MVIPTKIVPDGQVSDVFKPGFVTVKLKLLEVPPVFVTETVVFPVGEPVGTEKTMVVPSDDERPGIKVSPKFTKFSSAVNPEPVSVTIVPTGPNAGLMLLMTGELACLPVALTRNAASELPSADQSDGKDALSHLMYHHV